MIQSYMQNHGVSIYRYFSIKELEDILDIKNARSAVIINFKTKEVIRIDGVKDEGKVYHRLNEISKK